MRIQSAIPWALGAGLLWHGARSAVIRFEEQAADEIAAKLDGDSKKVSVKAVPNGVFGAAMGDLESATIRASNFTTNGLPLFTEPERSKKGRVQNLRIELKDFRLGSLDIESLTAAIPECRYDFALAMKKGQIRLSQSGTGTGEVRIAEKALERFVLAKFREILSVSIRCDRGWVWIEGVGEFLVIKTAFRVLAKLEPRTGNMLVLTRARVVFDGLPVDKEVADAVLQTLNPVVDLDKDLNLHGAIQVESVISEKGFLTVSGKTTIPNLPSAPK